MPSMTREQVEQALKETNKKHKEVALLAKTALNSANEEYAPVHIELQTIAGAKTAARKKAEEGLITMKERDAIVRDLSAQEAKLQERAKDIRKPLDDLVVKAQVLEADRMVFETLLKVGKNGKAPRPSKR